MHRFWHRAWRFLAYTPGGDAIKSRFDGVQTGQSYKGLRHVSERSDSRGRERRRSSTATARRSVHGAADGTKRAAVAAAVRRSAGAARAPARIRPAPAAGQQPGYAPQPAFGPQPQPIAYGHPPQPRQPQAFGAQDGHAQQQNQGYYFPQAQPEPEPAPAYAPQAAAGRPLPFESLAMPRQAWAAGAAAADDAALAAATRPAWFRSRQLHARGRAVVSAAEQSQFHQAREAAHFQPGDPGQHHADLDPGALPRQHDPARFESSHGYGENDADYDEILAEEEEQPRRGRRGMMIAAALVGAIGLGGALAYTYKTFFAASSGPAPRITASNAGPNKVKPVVPDGKSFPNTDKKLLNRLGEEESANPSGRVVIGVPPPPQSQQEAGDDPNAPRKVRIIPITPNSPQGAMPVTTGSAPAKPAGSSRCPA